MSSESDAAEAKRRGLSLILQVMGLFDIVLGILIVTLGPIMLPGEDPMIYTVLTFGGILMAVFGAGMFWWGRFRLRPPDDEDVIRKMSP